MIDQASPIVSRTTPPPGGPFDRPITKRPKVRANQPVSDDPGCRIATAAWTKWASTIVRVVLAVIWGWAGLVKLSDPDAALRAVRAYRIVPELLVRPVAWGTPFAEIALAVLLLLGVGRRAAPTLGAILLALFAIGIAQAWARNLQISCGCFGGGGPAHADAAQYAVELGRDLVLLSLSVWLMWRPASRFAIHSQP